MFYDDDYNYLQHLKDTNEMCMVEPMERFKIEEKADTPEQVWCSLYCDILLLIYYNYSDYPAEVCEELPS